MIQILPYLLTSFLYAGIGWLFWRSTWRSEPQKGSEAGSGVSYHPNKLHMAMFLPLFIHAVLLYRALIIPDAISFGVGSAVSVILWLTVLIYWFANFHYRYEGLQALLLPLASVAVLLPIILPATHDLNHTQSPAFQTHFVIALLAYSLFTVAALHTALMWVLEKHLHDMQLSTRLQGLPPLLSMEQLLFKIIAVGFVLLTLTLISGMFFSEELFGKPLQFSHKIIFAIISWAIFAALLSGRAFYGWRGKVAMRWTLAGFITLLLAYIGSKFVLEIILHR